MIRKFLMTVATASVAASAFAIDTANIEKSYDLKDGSTVHVFKDGKMGMEDKYGRAVTMAEGHAMETKDGGKIMMKGNEIWRVDRALRQHTSP